MDQVREYGRNLVLFTKETDEDDYEVAGFATDNTVDVQMDMVECTSPSSARAKEFRPGRYSWTMGATRVYTNIPMSFSANHEDDATVREIDWLKVGQKIYVGFSGKRPVWDTQYNGNWWKKYWGMAYVKSVRIAAPVNGVATFTVELQGTGELQDEEAWYANRVPPRQ